MHYQTDISSHKKLCLNCEWLNDIGDVTCKQCGTPVFQRKPYSLLRTWSYTLSAILFLIPANLLPMMIITKVGIDESNTIMEGVIYFVLHGEASIGVIIFLASIVIPIFKIAALLVLLLIVHFRAVFMALPGIRLYRFIQLIGKWSLLDIFVVAIMIAMVQFQNLATVKAGGAAFAFALSVILTMMATEAFDPRLMFDSRRDDE